MGCASTKAKVQHNEAAPKKIHPRALKLQEEMEQYRLKLTEHELYKNIQTPEDLRIFMEAHIYCVWDFMSILKTLQNNLTCTQVPWVPTVDASTRRLINEIVMEEESDVDSKNVPASHCELYLNAMKDASANTTQPMEFIKYVMENKKVDEGALQIIPQPHVRNFLDFTFDLCKKDTYIVAAVFTFARENLIPEMFSGLIRDMAKNLGDKIDMSGYLYYINRHIELDGDHHGPMSLDMVGQLCGDDDKKWEEARIQSIAALKSRELIWDGILEDILKNRNNLTQRKEVLNTEGEFTQHTALN